jgi:hypothetical protein
MLHVDGAYQRRCPQFSINAQPCFFPVTASIPAFSADPTAHRMKIGNIPGSKDMRASLGGVIPVVETRDRKLQVSTAASVQFGIHPSGQAEIVSMEFYLDYVILDYALAQHVYLRSLLGHTSHHLSDTEFEKRELTDAVNYSRDYTALYGVYSNDRTLLYGGANFGYVFHLEGKESKRWQLHFGGEQILTKWKSIHPYIAADSRWFQEASFQFANTYQCGIHVPGNGTRSFRATYQFRHGLDERGQFFPHHYSEHIVLFVIDL